MTAPRFLPTNMLTAMFQQYRPQQPNIRNAFVQARKAAWMTLRTALAFGLPAVARNIGRARRWSRALLDRAGHEAGRGKVVTATALVALYFVGL